MVVDVIAFVHKRTVLYESGERHAATTDHGNGDHASDDLVRAREYGRSGDDRRVAREPVRPRSVLLVNNRVVPQSSQRLGHAENELRAACENAIGRKNGRRNKDDFFGCVFQN